MEVKHSEKKHPKLVHTLENVSVKGVLNTMLKVTTQLADPGLDPRHPESQPLFVG